MQRKLVVICFFFGVVVQELKSQAYYSSPKQLRLSHNLKEERRDEPLRSQIINFRSQRRHNDNTGFEPGDNAAPFEIKTLDGTFNYPLQNNCSVIVHAFTNKSAFLECLWSTDASLTDLVEYLPENTHVLFLSLDDSAAKDALWMREQVYHLASGSQRGKEVISRLHFSPIPAFALGTWIPKILYSWGCSDHNCGLAQAVFTSTEWDVPLIVKSLNARYDWLMGHWGDKMYRLQDGGDGCKPMASVAGAVAWVVEEGCSFFTKLKNMADSKAMGVLVYTSAGQPIKDMNCIGEECQTGLGIPAAMVHFESSVDHALRSGKEVKVSFQTTPSPSFFFGINHQGVLSETGWFLYPTFRFLSWQAQWFEYQEVLRGRLERPATVVPVFDHLQMQGEKGAQATVDLPPGVMDYDVLELDASLSCPGRRDESCAHWDHTVQLWVCCDQLSPYCNAELGRWITAFRRGIGRWITDVSPLLPLLNAGKCAFTMKTVPWAMPWVVSLNLRFSHSNQSVQSDGDDVRELQPYKLTPLFGGGTFDKNYNSRFQPLKFTVPASAKRVELYAVITGHGSDENGCGEFCVTSHHFLVNGVFNNTRSFDTAGSALGCALRVPEGAVPNEHGTWLYGRGGWCDGLQVDPWRIDITEQLDLTGNNSIVYFGFYKGMDPNPARDPGYIEMSSYLVFYK
ncbi:uncharacterized protein si:dkey-256h2.1 [Engraulis encrasicolus]|uniref:uncharacterized protein si:dkey-256h2.1 n=1 Tax=Engraulis encrasicolus TaxID=184585 RepID=UPI002FD29CD1